MITNKFMATESERTILDTAKELFWNFGIQKVTVKEICKEAGVSKMTFYRAFRNKEEVAALVVDEFIDKIEHDYEAVLVQSIGFPEKVQQLIGLEYKYSSKMSKALLKDLYQREKKGLALKLEKSQERLMKLIEIHFKEAQDEGWINPDLSMDFILYMLNELNHKVEDEKLLMMYTHPSKLIMDLTNFFFYGIANKDVQG